MKTRPTGPEAARWRKRKFDQIKRFSIPDDLLPGSLSRSLVHCGKSNCHCASEEEGHPHWSLTFMSDGTRRVVHIPDMLVDQVRRQVEAGKEFQHAVRDVLTANAELLALTLKQEKQRRRTKRR